jgi:hypothetical protein
MKTLRDFIYLDIDKATSIYSQLTGGLVTASERVTGTEKDQRNIRKYNLKVFTPEFGGAEKTTQKLVETHVMHHDLFNRMEELLFSEGLAIDINSDLSPEMIASGEGSSVLSRSYYVRCTGWCVMEDYEKMKGIADRYNDVFGFIRRSSIEGLKESDEYKTLKGQIEQLKEDANSNKDRNKKAIAKRSIRKLEQDLDTQLANSSELSGVDEWIIEGIKTWIDTFMAGDTIFYVYPFETSEGFHVKSHLRSDCFVDGDIGVFDSCYTSRPTVRLSVFGLVTSVPPMGGEHPFDPMREFEGHVPEDENDDQVGFEKAMRGCFRGFDGLESFIRFNRYPNITVYPLAVFREIGAHNATETQQQDAMDG